MFRTVFGLLVLAHTAHSHSPVYASCENNCCNLPHNHKTSQVVYFEGSGGIEIPITDTTFAVDEILQLDVVLKSRVNQTLYNIYVGCGSCSDPFPTQQSLSLGSYGDARLEPFTQIMYQSALSPVQQQFATNSLEGCSSFTIRLQSDQSDTVIKWGAVVGTNERFTFMELLSFPIYILTAHNEWNDLGYTYWLWLFLTTVFFLVLVLISKLRFGPSLQIRKPREVLYLLSIIGFVAASAEEFTHLFYVQFQLPEVGGEFFTSFFMVNILANVTGFMLTWVFWVNARVPFKIMGHPRWSFLEIFAGFSLLLFIGSGFYLGPVALMAAGLFRSRNLCPSRVEQLENVVTNTQSGVVRVVKEAQQLPAKGLGFLNNGDTGTTMKKMTKPKPVDVESQLGPKQGLKDDLKKCGNNNNIKALATKKEEAATKVPGSAKKAEPPKKAEPSKKADPPKKTEPNKKQAPPDAQKPKVISMVMRPKSKDYSHVQKYADPVAHNQFVRREFGKDRPTERDYKRSWREARAEREHNQAHNVKNKERVRVFAQRDRPEKPSIVSSIFRARNTEEEFDHVGPNKKQAGCD